MLPDGAIEALRFVARRSHLPAALGRWRGWVRAEQQWCAVGGRSGCLILCSDLLVGEKSPSVHRCPLPCRTELVGSPRMYGAGGYPPNLIMRLCLSFAIHCCGSTSAGIGSCVRRKGGECGVSVRICTYLLCPISLYLFHWLPLIYMGTRDPELSSFQIYL